MPPSAPLTGISGKRWTERWPHPNGLPKGDGITGCKWPGVAVHEAAHRPFLDGGGKIVHHVVQPRAANDKKPF